MTNDEVRIRDRFATEVLDNQLGLLVRKSNPDGWMGRLHILIVTSDLNSV